MTLNRNFHCNTAKTHSGSSFGSVMKVITVVTPGAKLNIFAEQISVGNTVLPMCCLLEVVLREERMRQPWLVKTLAGGKCQYLKSPKFPS